jgi:hypothetical protein
MLVGIAQLQAKTWHKFEYDAGIDNREVIFAGRVQIIHLLDDVVALAWLFRDQGKRDQPEIALRQHASGPHEVVAAHAVLSAPATSAAPAATPMPHPGTMAFPVSHPEHPILSCFQRYTSGWVRSAVTAQVLEEIA